jgi:hypothetical protein
MGCSSEADIGTKGVLRIYIAAHDLVSPIGQFAEAQITVENAGGISNYITCGLANLGQ